MVVMVESSISPFTPAPLISSSIHSSLYSSCSFSSWTFTSPFPLCPLSPFPRSRSFLCHLLILLIFCSFSPCCFCFYSSITVWPLIIFPPFLFLLLFLLFFRSYLTLSSSFLLSFSPYCLPSAFLLFLHSPFYLLYILPLLLLLLFL